MKAVLHFKFSTLHSSHFLPQFLSKQNDYWTFFISIFNFKISSVGLKDYKSFLFIVTLTNFFFFDTYFALFSFCLIFLFLWFFWFSFIVFFRPFYFLFLHGFNEKYFLSYSVFHLSYWSDWKCSFHFITGV